MKNLKKRVLAMVITLVMALGLIPSALAAGPTFSDVPETYWGYADIDAVAEAGLMNGTGNREFSPEMKVSVAQFLTLLGRLVFPDVKTEGSDWFGPYVTAAQSAGLLTGTQVNTGNVEAEISRYDMAVILRAAAKQLGVAEKTALSSEVTDYGEIPPTKYAEAVLAVYGMGLIRGDQAGNFNGSNTMMRAEVATVIMRLKRAAQEPAPAESAVTDPGTFHFTTVEAGKLHVSTNAAFPPYEMVEGYYYVGIDIELAVAIAQKLGLELVVDDMDFDRALVAVQAGWSDASIAAIMPRGDRREVMDFSDIYERNVQVIIVKEGSLITTVDDLDFVGRIGTKRGTTGAIYCPEDYGEDRVVTYGTGAAAVQALVNGQVDCVVLDDKSAQAFVAAHDGLVILDSIYSDEEYAIAVQKGNDPLRLAINAALAQLRAEGTLQAIVDRYVKAE